MAAFFSFLPTLRFLRLLALGAPLWLLELILPGGWLVGFAYVIFLVALGWRDATALPRPLAIAGRRELPPRLALDTEHSIKLVVSNRATAGIRALVRDELPASFEVLDELPPLEVPPGGEAHLDYAVRPRRRGAHAFGDIVLRLQGERGLVQRQISLAAENTAKVYPNFRGVDRYQLLVKIDQRDEIARRPLRSRAPGTDFESLRPYVSGEDPRHIDWKATARRGALVSRNQQVEKGQQLAVLIDAGRLMAETVGDHSKLEHALNATVMLSYVAQRRGDALAVASFSNRIESFLPSVRGPSLLPRVLESLYAVEARPVESDYWQVIAQVMTLLRRRSLVILLTDILDASASAGLLNNLARAAEKHLVLCVVLAEPRIGEIARSIPANLTEAYRKAAACDQQRRRRLAIESMRAKGILVMETDPAHLSIQLVQRYLEIRQADLQ